MTSQFFYGFIAQLGCSGAGCDQAKKSGSSSFFTGRWYDQLARTCLNLRYLGCFSWVELGGSDQSNRQPFLGLDLPAPDAIASSVPLGNSSACPHPSTRSPGSKFRPVQSEQRNTSVCKDLQDTSHKSTILPLSPGHTVILRGPIHCPFACLCICALLSSHWTGTFVANSIFASFINQSRLSDDSTILIRNLHTHNVQIDQR